MIELILATICICLIFLMCWKICDDMFNDAGVKYLAWIASGAICVFLIFATTSFIRG